MFHTTRVHGFTLAIAASATLLASAPEAFAEAVTLTDIAGREVTLPEMPDKIILGEGRMMYAVAPLTDGNPFEKIVGWKDDLVLYDPDAFRKFEAVFPDDAARIINFGNPYAGTSVSKPWVSQRLIWCCSISAISSKPRTLA